MTNTDFESKKQNPSDAYSHPREVVQDAKLSREQKIEILREWHYDALRLQDSASENMTGDDTDRLSAVSKALLELGVSPAKEGDPKSEAKTSPLRRAHRYIKSAVETWRGGSKSA